jgi:hypothetical protein
VSSDGQEPVDEPVGETVADLDGFQTYQLITRWAPILYQSVTQAGGTGSWGRADFMTSFDYDGDFNGQNNWDNIDANRLNAAMYGLVSESTTHYFIYYTMFHPRSWINSSFYDEHENDAEGAVLLVRKDGGLGKLEAVITAFHGEGKVYRASVNVGDNPSNCAGGGGWRGCSQTHALITSESFESQLHPQLFMEAEGHGLAACPASDNCGMGNANMIRYVPSFFQGGGQPVLPIQGTQTVGYNIVDLGDLYKRRFDRPTFFDAAVMAGDESGSCGDGGDGGDSVTVVCNDNKTNAIWSYGVSNTPECANNGLGEDPASVFRAIFSFNNGLTPPSSDYTWNRLQHPKCDKSGRRLMGSSDPCVQQICALDPYCCNNSWDEICQGEVASVCGQSCTNANACICTEHDGPIGTGSDGQCAARICAADSYCCNERWDALCVDEVASVCGLNCSGLVGGNCARQ